jgi:hypothetical protein
MQRKDVLKALRSRKAFLDGRVAALVAINHPRAFEEAEAGAIAYAIGHLEENLPQPDERALRIMTKFKVEVTLKPSLTNADREQLKSDAEYLWAFSKTGYGSGQHKAGIVAQFIKTVLLRD